MHIQYCTRDKPHRANVLRSRLPSPFRDTRMDFDTAFSKLLIY